MAEDDVKLRALAEAATPGPWGAEKATGGRSGILELARVYSEPVRETAEFADEVADCIDSNDGAFIAAADPTTILALLDRVDRLEFELSEAQTDLDNEREFREGDKRLADHWAARAQAAEGAVERVRALAKQADHMAEFCRGLRPTSDVLQAITDHETYARSMCAALDQP